MKPFLIAGTLLGGSGVVLGAFGAHGLESILSPGQIDSWETAVLYQLVHAIVLIILPRWAEADPSPWLLRAGWTMLGGTLLFSGSIYLLLLTGLSWLGPITPLGGVAFIAGWAMLLRAAFGTK